MIKIFSAEQYMKANKIDKLTENLETMIDQIISLEIAIFHMSNTNKPKFCDGYNVSVLIELRRGKIDYFESLSKLKYVCQNNFYD